MSHSTQDLPALTSFLEGLPEPHIVFDRSYRILAANAAYLVQFSGGEHVIGRTCYEVSHHFNVPCDQAGESCPLAKARATGQRERLLHLHHTHTGQTYVNIELQPLCDDFGEQRWFVEKMEPLTSAHTTPRSDGLIGKSAPFQQMLTLVSRVAPTDAAVLLLGETGTGKDLVAQTLHAASSRSHRALVPVDCSSLTETLFESELFGHERGAFTGAHSARPGLVEAAHEGTLFLDEVGDIPLPMQVKLLRLLESGTYRRVGSSELRRANFRVISATHRDLALRVQEGMFREDLYHRLNTFPIRVPAVRERPDDIPLLVEALLKRTAPHRRLRLAQSALDLLRQHPFKGNVRELRNLMDRVAVLCDGILVDDKTMKQALELGQTESISRDYLALPGIPSNQNANLREQLDLLLLQRWQEHQGSRSELAAEFGISERTLYRKIKALAEK